MMNKASMNLLSPSGYAMHFELRAGSPLEIIRNYGKKPDPQTGKLTKYNGVDFKVAPSTWLKALATGTITGISQDTQRGSMVQATYFNPEGTEECRYDVIYKNLSYINCRFGQQVTAGDNIAMSKDVLPIEVRYNGETIDPIPFLAMVRDNLVMQSQKQMNGNNPEIASMDMDVHTPYDDYQSEIDSLYGKFLLPYLYDTVTGRYLVRQTTSDALSALINEGLRRRFIFECIPSTFNPAGLGASSIDWQGRIQTILFEDFQLYLASKHGIFLSHLSENEKKKLLTSL